MSRAASQQQPEEIPHPHDVPVAKEGGMVTISPPGPLFGEQEAQSIVLEGKAILDELGTEFCMLVLDLSGVQMMSSVGVNACLEFRNCATIRGVPTVLVGLSNGVRELFRMMNVDRLFTVVETLGDLKTRVAA